MAAVEAFAAGGGVDIAVTAAGFGHVAGVLELTADEWRRMIDVHLNGTFHCAQAAASSGERVSSANPTLERTSRYSGR